jgi:5-carboxymethyl-2-hydroxymuconate isomerase
VAVTPFRLAITGISERVVAFSMKVPGAGRCRIGIGGLRREIAQRLAETLGATVDQVFDQHLLALDLLLEEQKEAPPRQRRSPATV